MRLEMRENRQMKIFLLAVAAAVLAVVSSSFPDPQVECETLFDPVISTVGKVEKVRERMKKSRVKVISVFRAL